MSRYEKEWEKWGGRDPYFAVLTDDRFHVENLNEKSLEEFFESGRAYVEFLLSTVRARFDSSFSPRMILDFGCGVGRLAIPFSETGAEVLGVDVSNAMIGQAARHAKQRGVSNARFEHLKRFLDRPLQQFDLVNAYITFQHVPSRDGEGLLHRMIDSVREDGFAAIHILHARPGRLWKPVADWARRSVPG
ncbi:MAG: class I SAM-dependent methyltransferase, partial [Acidobacteria bacterium]|nr:class I SAM-dependent methyltransferase [Acidobacteriota bacterium]